MSESLGIEFPNRAAWRKWLEEHDSSEKEFWVIIHKKKSERKGLTYSEAVEEAICFGWIDSKMQTIDASRFRQRFSPRKKNSIWSKSNKETAEKLILQGKMAPPGFETIKEAKSNGKWDAAYSSKMAPAIPEDLAKTLKANEPAWRNFSAFSNSAKLQYVYWVNSAKKDETRQKRISAVVEKALQKIKPS
jgi:uncharacterized protein YdeI (YjbR/CyaY-like superfamily)